MLKVETTNSLLSQTDLQKKVLLGFVRYKILGSGIIHWGGIAEESGSRDTKSTSRRSWDTENIYDGDERVLDYPGPT